MLHGPHRRERGPFWWRLVPALVSTTGGRPLLAGAVISCAAPRRSVSRRPPNWRGDMELLAENIDNRDSAS
jgi:hypothetical protein